MSLHVLTVKVLSRDAGYFRHHVARVTESSITCEVMKHAVFSLPLSVLSPRDYASLTKNDKTSEKMFRRREG